MLLLLLLSLIGRIAATAAANGVDAGVGVDAQLLLEHEECEEAAPIK